MAALQGTLPASWGQNGIFPLLKDLFLSYNPALGGTLPPAWGADGSSLAAVERLQITNTNVSGGLPASWAAQMPGLRALDVSSNSITGASAVSSAQPSSRSLGRALVGLSKAGRLEMTASLCVAGALPAQWSALTNLTVLNLGRNQLTGGSYHCTASCWCCSVGTVQLTTCQSMPLA